jgi:two-component system sensor histidine kinase/response regulator
MIKILIIEDETSIRKNILEMLEMEGYEGLEAEDGITGLAMAQDHVPDLIICDITMPNLDGYEVLLELRKTPETATIPFIFLTARADRSFMRHGMELGADDYLTKPFTLSELRSAIAARLERRSTYNTQTHQELEQARRVLIQMVSHELRTPLVAINTATEIISRQIGQLSNAEVQELMESIQRGGQRLGRVVEQIVLIVQIETGSMTRETIAQMGRQVQVTDLLIAALDLARSFAYRRPDVTIRLDERDNNAAVQCDMRVLKHALAELLGNALSFSPPGHEVHVSQWCADGSVWISIVDQGPGISPEQVEFALQDFQQIDRAVNEQQGIGLGLPLSRHIIELHGGTFELNSVVDKGTQVIISLPIAAGTDAD